MDYDVLTGVDSAASGVAANQMPDVDRVLFLLKPYQYPIFQWIYFAQGKKAQAVTNEKGKFTWFEDGFVGHQTTLAGAGIAGGATSEDNIGLTDSDIFAEGDIIFVDLTEEMVRVDSTASSQVDITKMGSGNITAATTGYVRKIGSYNSEYELARAPVSTKEEELYNYLTIFNESVAQTGRRQAGKNWTDGKTFADQVQKKIEEMKFMYERNLIFSTDKGITTTTTTDGTFDITWGEGFLGRYTTNKVGYSTLTETAFDAYLETIFAKGNSVKMHIAGASQITAINKIIKDRYKVEPRPIVTKYGIRLAQYITPFGDLNVMRDPLLEGTKFSNWGITFDNEYVKMRYMANDDKGSRKFRIEENVQTPGRDAKQTKILADIGIQLAQEITGGILYKTS
jgi:hypothetical protein